MATDMEPQPNPQHTRRWITAVFLASLTLVALYFCFIIARPFLTSILWALIIAVPFHPVHDRLHRVIHNKSAAALVSVVIVILIVIVPAFLLGMATINELKNAYQSVSERTAAGGGWAQYFNDMSDSASHWIGGHVGASSFDLKREIMGRIGQLSSVAGQIAGGILGNVTSVLVQGILTLFILFFMLRDGHT